VEVELALVIGRPVFEASTEEAAHAILGWTIANDVTTSNICGRDHHLARSKSLISFCPLGVILRRGIDTGVLRMTTTINGYRTQDGCTRDRILGDAESVALVSKIMPLFPGDVILTGTPAGAMGSLITPGDRVELEIESIGRLANPIVRRGFRRT
jgi:2-keto-4-pentenoate hydratase/2-oxohepta-3-ene-1,7-dioic acid hydratase in catechol pathway